MNRKPEKFAGRRVTVVGLGHFGGGVGVSRWLCRQGAQVTVTDMAPAEKLADAVAELKGLDIRFHLGGHEEADFTRTDLLVVNPAVPKEMELLKLSARAGVPRTSEINLFIERCPARIVGITGSVGKSTTTAMTGEILRQRFTTHVGGNIGGSLLESLDRIEAEHLVVLELSSFQLEDLPLVRVGPHVALVTNLRPNHLDRHGTLEAYGDAKKNIFRFQGADDVLILNAQDPPTAAWAAEAPGRVEFFNANPASRDRSKTRPGGKGAEPFDLLLPGAHNQANAQAAWAVARQFDIDRPTAAAALKTFAGLPHRLEFVTERDGVRYFNDSKCTTPDGAIVAMESFEERRVVIIVGGYDKHVSFDAMGAALAKRAKAVVAVGATGGQIVEAVEMHRAAAGEKHPAAPSAAPCVAQPLVPQPLVPQPLVPQPLVAQPCVAQPPSAGSPTPPGAAVPQAAAEFLPKIIKADSFAGAVAAARAEAAPGDVVLLSPACASYGLFTNYEQRGKTFVELVTR